MRLSTIYPKQTLACNTSSDSQTKDACTRLKLPTGLSDMPATVLSLHTCLRESCAASQTLSSSAPVV